MKFKIETKPNPLRQLDNFKQLKTVLKPIKTDEQGKFLDTLLHHCELLHSVIGRNYGSSDYDYFEIHCEVYFNLPLVSIAFLGNSSHRSLEEFDKSGTGTTFEKRNELGEFLQKLESIPNSIEPVRLELTQKIGGAKSKYVYEVMR